ncbi:hypothetical protein B5F76_02135 [Desulfovibrio sp. An276]|uniref:Panacea domain-containing protein n=1 Tax=Desulfovibrio sp. An276 TaxID=1965618 RepID=UPI000B39CD64|nr:type II toxin-antitoxin system antitoxin SocA domain-containing protein [Desulfovibrio sp. An276]OUO54660.1 hypothetical protein B5F76_02135 [Desulfovibrio sp. An276]
MEKALAIANFFITLGVERECPPTQMKLQKLVYFAHGWHLGLYDQPLIEETFQAWKYGPVIPSLYLKFRDYGTFPIKQVGTIAALTADMKITHLIPPIKNFQNLKPFLTKIQDVYGKWNGTQLSALTHQPDTPWSQVRKDYPEDTKNIPIPNDLLRDYFKRKANES